MTTPSEHLLVISWLYELEGDKRRATAFRTASEAVAGRTDFSVKLPGVGASSVQVIDQFLATGTSDRFEALAEHWPVDQIVDLARVKGIGPKKAMALIERGITSLPELVKAVQAGDVSGTIADEALRTAGAGRIERAKARPIAQAVLKALRAVPGVLDVKVCGSWRRGRETVKDLDVVASAPKRVHGKLHRALGKLGKGRSTGTVRSAVLVEGLQVDLWTVEPKSWGAAVAHATGSKAHNVWRRTALKKIGIRENEYGLWRGKKRIGGADEGDAYRLLGVDYVEPKDRES